MKPSWFPPILAAFLAFAVLVFSFSASAQSQAASSAVKDDFKMPEQTEVVSQAVARAEPVIGSNPVGEANLPLQRALSLNASLNEVAFSRGSVFLDVPLDYGLDLKVGERQEVTSLFSSLTLLPQPVTGGFNPVRNVAPFAGTEGGVDLSTQRLFASLSGEGVIEKPVSAEAEPGFIPALQTVVPVPAVGLLFGAAVILGAGLMRRRRMQRDFGLPEQD